MAAIRNRFALLATAAGTVVLAMGIAACGDDDDDGGDDEVAQLEITASGGRDDLSFAVDQTELESGATEITLANDSEGPVDGQLSFVEAGDERTPQEVADAFGNAVNNRPVPEFFHAAGGPGSIEPGGTATVTQELQPGTYYLLPADDVPAGDELVSFEVTEGDGAELPETEGKVSAVEYSFSGEGLTAGANEIVLENTGGQWHHFLASKLREGATIDEAKAYLQSEGRAEGPPPFEENPEQTGNYVESTVLDPGFSQVVEARLDPGTYAFYCFIPDKQGGPPHVAKGMVSEVTVSE